MIFGRKRRRATDRPKWREGISGLQLGCRSTHRGRVIHDPYGGLAMFEIKLNHQLMPFAGRGRTVVLFSSQEPLPKLVIPSE